MKHIYLHILLLMLIGSQMESVSQVNFKQHQLNSSTNGSGGIYCCDMDNDGDIDILLAGLQDQAVIMFENLGGNPLAWNKKIIGTAREAHSVYSADFNADGNPDIISAAYAGAPGVAYWESDGQQPPTWTKNSVSNSFTNAHEVFAHDLDNDGDMDILAASSDLNKISWWRNDGGSPIVWAELGIDEDVALAKSVAAGDINGDGLEDVVGASIMDNYIAWWENDSSSAKTKGLPLSWEKHFISTNFYGAHRAQLIDIDKDGDLDVLGAAYIGNQIAWWRNDGGTNSLTWKKFLIKSNFVNACVAFGIDLDQDDDIDVIGSSQGNNELKAWLNSGDSTITWDEITVDGDFNRVWPVHAADLDGDTDIDIVAATSHNGNREVRWYENLLITGVENKENNLGNSFSLSQNYPNPFNPTTTIKYSIEKQLVVSLRVYDILSREVKVLVNEVKPAGSYEVKFDAFNLPSGAYLIKLTAGNFRSVKKAILLK